LAGERNEAEDDLCGSLSSRGSSAVLAVRSLAGANGLNIPLFFQQLFANHIGAFFGMDVFVSAAALLVFVRSEGSRLGVQGRWLPVIAVLAVGVSLGLPLFLYLREHKLEQDRAGTKTAAV